MTKPRRSSLRPLTDLCDILGCTPAALYSAADKGYIRVINVGNRKKLTEAAFTYHAENGYGKDVPPFEDGQAAG